MGSHCWLRGQGRRRVMTSWDERYMWIIVSRNWKSASTGFRNDLAFKRNVWNIRWRLFEVVLASARALTKSLQSTTAMAYYETRTFDRRRLVYKSFTDKTWWSLYGMQIKPKETFGGESKMFLRRICFEACTEVVLFTGWYWIHHTTWNSYY